MEGDRPQDRNLKAGLGVVVGNSLYKGDDTRVFPVPMLYYNFGKFGIRGSMLGYELFEDDAVAVSAIAKWRFDGYDEDDSDYLDGMDERKMSLDGGFQLVYSDGWGQSSFSWVTDMLGRHDGQELVVSYSKRFAADKFSFTPSAGLMYSSGNLNDYYYGVMADEALANRPMYEASKSWNPFVSLNIGYEINERWSVMSLVGYQWLSSEITDSPIVDDDYKAVIMTGLMYGF
jgi:MipA family protein